MGALSPGERAELIGAIAERLPQRGWHMVRATLAQFGVSLSDGFAGTIDAYVIQHVQYADDATLTALANHLGYGSLSLTNATLPASWQRGMFKVFVSHLAAHKVAAGELQSAFERYGVGAFVAHTDIQPTEEWQNQIEIALATCDAVVALLHEGFHESKWTDQEIGYAMGRGVLVVTVRLGQDPYGFIGRFQAVAGLGKNANALALELAETFIKHSRTGPRFTAALVFRLEYAREYRETRAVVSLLSRTQWGTRELAARCLQAIDSNDQVRDAWGMVDQIRAMVQRWTA